jgi:hypothetical protein
MFEELGFRTNIRRNSRIEIDQGQNGMFNPLFWLLTYKICWLPHGWTRDFKWPSMGIMGYGGFGGMFLKPTSCGVRNHQRVQLIFWKYSISLKVGNCVPYVRHHVDMKDYTNWVLNCKHHHHFKCLLQLSMTHTSCCTCHTLFYPCWYENIGWQKWMSFTNRTTISWTTSGPQIN